MISIKIKVFPRADLATQLAFAGSQALNDAAFAIRAELATSLGDSFTIRNTWTAKGMRVAKRANKRAPMAEVGSTREYLLGQTFGDTRTRASIPAAIRRSQNTMVRRGRWPGTLLSQGGRYFKLDTGASRLPGTLSGHRGRKHTLIVERQKRRLKVLWVIPEQGQRIKPRWPFEQIATAGFARSFPEAMQRRFAAALRTAR